ncbi:MAG: glycoside hydrolase family 9 [Calditrichaeota bacterium]|nr:glycoside hydrolase family 9 [Calditrichota bacterium]
MRWWRVFGSIVLVWGVSVSALLAQPVYIRVNQIGYLPSERKIAVAFCEKGRANLHFELVDAATHERVWGPAAMGRKLGHYGRFPWHVALDFSKFQKPGRYQLRIVETGDLSIPFRIGQSVYGKAPAAILAFLRQQRCGYNPFLDEVCHTKDGRTVEGPVPDGTYLDVSGGWHDAADYLRYLLTSSNVVGRLLLAYRLAPDAFVDSVDALGHPFPNGVPDILDEARWGLVWMLKMHPDPDQLYHQVADDRDHSGWDLPYEDTSDYGWGPGSYRVVYYATGKPQGLGRFKSQSTGVANLAGRYAAAMAMAAVEFAELDPPFAQRCLRAGQEVYRLGLKQPGCQEGTPHNAPYRYHESTWADDMEWGAAELFRVTGDSAYLRQAVRFARRIAATSWMGRDSVRHYEFYPFFNAGHFALFDFASPGFRDSLAAYYREGIEACQRRADRNPYGVGIPFVWCSNNLAAALVNQILLYEKMTGDRRYHALLQAHRDWLLGRNPWGVSQFVALPEDGVTPLHPHSVIASETGRTIVGGLVDGPVYTSIFRSLRGIHLSGPDPLAPFQSDWIVYHDDLWDYSTNEPTLDGTARRCCS